MLIGLYMRPSLFQNKSVKRIFLLLDRYRELFAKVLAVSFGFSFSAVKESFLFCLVVKLTHDGVKIVAFPIGPSSFSLHDFIIRLYLYIVIDDVFVCDDIVLANWLSILQ